MSKKVKKRKTFPKPTGKSKIKTWTGKILRNLPTPKFMVDKLIREKAFIEIYGMSGTLKSFFIQLMVFAMHLGISVWGRDCKKASIYMLVLEGKYGLSKRFQGHEYLYDKPNAFDDLHGSSEMLSFMQPANMPHLIANIRYDLQSEHIDLLVIDTLAYALAPGDENTAKDMGVFNMCCRKLQEELDCAIVVVHHTGKDQKKGGRGSSAAYAAYDMVMYVEAIPPNTPKGETPPAIKITCEKDRDYKPFKDFALLVKEIKFPLDGEDEDDMTGTTLTLHTADENLSIGMLKLSAQNDKIYRCLIAACKLKKYRDKGLTKGEWETMVEKRNVPKETFKKGKKVLLAQRLVKHDITEGRYKPWNNRDL
jgi:hypothetical protein